MHEALDALEIEYCPPIDPALLSAILSDYDIASADGLRAARRTLDQLKRFALTEETSNFDPSGTSGSADLIGRADADSSRPESCPDLNFGTSHTNSKAGTNDESDSRSTISLLERRELGVSDQQQKDSISQYQHLSTEDKEQRLDKIFPSLREFDISYALKKNNDDFERTIDELLNLVYMEESGVAGDKTGSSKGIEAFAEEMDFPRRRNRKTKAKKHLIALSDDARSYSLPSSRSHSGERHAESKWELMRKEIEFINSRTSIPLQLVTSTYHECGASLSKCLRALLDSDIGMYYQENPASPVVAFHVSELEKDFPSISTSHRAGLVCLTFPSVELARELAIVLAGKPIVQEGRIEIITKFEPIDFFGGTGRTKLRLPGKEQLSHTSASTLAKSYGEARNQAFEKASAAYKKSKSNPLYGGASAYYSADGREYHARKKQLDAAAAEALVDSQSSPTVLDLHGINVKEAVNISRERVTAWWVGLGESRLNSSKSYSIGSGFRIVTGVGRHSEGGRSRLGPAVGKMLLREGWKVQFGEGYLNVTGVVRPPESHR